MEKMLQDRVAIITGSGRGIGKAAALLFGEEGAKVVVSDLDPEPAEETASEIRAGGGEAIVVAGENVTGFFQIADDPLKLVKLPLVGCVEQIAGDEYKIQCVHFVKAGCHPGKNFRSLSR